MRGHGFTQGGQFKAFVNNPFVRRLLLNQVKRIGSWQQKIGIEKLGGCAKGEGRVVSGELRVESFTFFSPTLTPGPNPRRYLP